MNTTCTVATVALVALLSSCAIPRAPEIASARNDAERPNIVLFFADDLGYGDIGPYGSGIATPNLDQLARDGMRFTDFHVAEPVCTASRVALLTGSYAQRVGLGGALAPNSPIGISSEELLLPELLKTKGYATAIFGKWHLGDLPPFLPTRHGFDEYFGVPYSTDMWPSHPTNGDRYPPLPLVEGERVSELNPDQRKLTAEFTRRAVGFIGENRERPFFLYVPYPLPHVPLFVSDGFGGRSGKGLYGDVIQEIDWSVGEVLAALRQHGLERNTLVIFTSDNGPWLAYGDHAGSSGGLREGKHTSWEGGHREPAIFRWPGRIPAGTVNDQFASTLDVLPTIARLVRAPLPEREIDGHDVWGLLSGAPGAKSPWESFYHYRAGGLEAVRSGRWKLVLPHSYVDVVEPGRNGQPGKTVNTPVAQELYDLASDPAETTDLAARHPEVVARMLQLAESARAELGDRLTRRVGADVRQPGRAGS